MSEFDCSRIVYSSSATVYGDPPEVPIPETTRLKADSPYGRSKVMCESVIEDLAHGTSFCILVLLQCCERVSAAEPKRWRAISLRYFNPAGAHPSGLIGEDPRGRPGNLLPLLAQMAIGRLNESTLQVFGDDYPTPCVSFFYVVSLPHRSFCFPFFGGVQNTDDHFSLRDGTCVRDYLHVLDLAAGHLLALDALAPGSTTFDNCPTPAHYKAYNLGRGQGFSVLQILEAMRAETGFNYTYNIIGRRCVFSCLLVMLEVSFFFRRGDVPDLTADPSLAEKELGFRAKQDLKTMCRDLWNWQTKNPSGYGSD
jgi:UDP-glucose 4-epimerase